MKESVVADNVSRVYTLLLLRTLCCLVLRCFRAGRAVSRWRCGWQSGSREPPSVTSSAANSSLSFLPRSTLLTVINAANTRGRPLYSGEHTRGSIAIIYKLARAHRLLPSLLFRSTVKSINSQGIDFFVPSKHYFILAFHILILLHN